MKAERKSKNKSIADDPCVRKYYNPSLNGGVSPENIALYSNSSIIFECNAIPGERHVWKAWPANFSRNVHKELSGRRHGLLIEGGFSPTSGCPGCSGRMATEKNNLLEAIPEVFDYWDYERNEKGPESHLPKSAEKVFWIDPESGTKSKASVASRTQRGLRIGTNRADSGFEATESNNIQELHPGVAARLCGDADPRDITPCSNDVFRWQCVHYEEHKFDSAVYTITAAEKARTKVRGCPFCRGFSFHETVSLKSKRSQISEEYDDSQLNNVSSDEIHWRSGEKGFFKCRRCDDIWSTRISLRTAAGQGCPACDGKKVTEKNCLSAMHPEVAAEWHPRNEFSASSVTEQSSRKVWWFCSKKSSHPAWKAVVADRVNGTGCPACSRSGVSREQLNFFSVLEKKLPTLQYESRENTPLCCYLQDSRFKFDAVLPESNIAVEYDGIYWHGSEKARKHDIRKNCEAMGKGIYIIRVRQGLPKTSGLDVIPDEKESLETQAEQVFDRIMLIKGYLENGEKDKVIDWATPRSGDC